MKAMGQAQPEVFTRILYEGFIDDPGILFQMGEVDDREAAFWVTCKGEIEAFQKLGYVSAIQNEGIRIGFTTIQRQEPEFAEVMGEMGQSLLREMDEQTIEAVQRKAAELAKISSPDWFKRFLGSQPVYILQVVAVDRQARGTGICRKLLTPLFEMCAEKKMPIALQTNNPKNVSLYEHFGFELMETLSLENADIACYNMLKRF